MAVSRFARVMLHTVTSPPLPQHRTCGSAYGDLAKPWSVRAIWRFATSHEHCPQFSLLSPCSRPVVVIA
jgi:hypothetical protein